MKINPKIKRDVVERRPKRYVRATGFSNYRDIEVMDTLDFQIYKYVDAEIAYTGLFLCINDRCYYTEDEETVKRFDKFNKEAGAK